jgi:lysophospholipase L1-like esterase
VKAIGLATLILAFLVQDPPGATPAAKAGGWLKRHEDFVLEARQGGIQVLFQGDSITDGWRNGAAKKIWDAAFGTIQAANFGISGDRTQHVLWRLQNGELGGSPPPRVVVLLIGTNNIGQKDPEPASSAIAGIDAILKLIHQKSGTTKVLLLGVFPRGEKPDHPQRALVKEINSAIQKFDDEGKSVRFLDIGEAFLQPDGVLTKEIMPDFLHLSPQGYQIWADAIKEPLVALLR